MCSENNHNFGSPNSAPGNYINFAICTKCGAVLEIRYDVESRKLYTRLIDLKK